MATQVTNGKGKRSPSALTPGETRVLGGVALLLLIVGSTIFLHHRLSFHGPKEGLLGGTPQATLRRAHLMEEAAVRQQAMLEDTDKLVSEVTELQKELSAIRLGGDQPLSQRERLWHEKEAALADTEGVPAPGENLDLQSNGGEAARTEGGGSGGGGGNMRAGSGLNAAGQLQRLLDGGTVHGAVRPVQQGAHTPVAVPSRRGGVLSSLVTWPGQPEPSHEPVSEEEVQRRRAAVVEAMEHSWGGYVKYAWGHDELAPVSKKGKDGFGGLGATIIDSLDTLLMMGMRQEYERAVKWIEEEMQLEAAFDASVFETIIRVVGGFLAAHDMTGDEVLLRKSEEVAKRLLPAYNTTTGIPFNTINLKTQKVKNPNWNLKASTLAEFGTHQMEFAKLSQQTGNDTYARLADATIRHLYENNPGQGLMPLFVSPVTGRFTTRKVSFGALGDSYYEYLLKVWVLRGSPPDDMFREMWEQAMDEMIDRLVFTSKEGYVYIAEYDRNMVKHKMDHLVCFVPGMLALGVHTGAVSGAKADKYLEVAAGVTHTCWQMYRAMPTGLSPEYVMFSAAGLRVGAPYNLLRPEALEAFWYMWRTTKDWKYRAWAWEVFQAFQRLCRTEAGYSGIKDVRRDNNVTQDDTQQSFFLAETLKYLYLIFSPDDALSWDEWVLNTEAHPMRIMAADGGGRGSFALPGEAAAGGAASKLGRKFGLGGINSLWRRRRSS